MRALVCWSLLPLAPTAAPIPKPMRAPITACRLFLGPDHIPLEAPVRGYWARRETRETDRHCASAGIVWLSPEQLGMFSRCVYGLSSAMIFCEVRLSFAVCPSPVCA